jgi:hypothetical protein
MFVVAITRWGAGGSIDIEPEAAALARDLGVTPYEARLLASAPAPAVLLETRDVSAARTLLGALRARGHGAVACDGATVSGSEALAAPKQIAFGPEALIGQVPGAGELCFPYADVLALLPALHVREDESTSVHQEKKLSLTRAALTGGLVRNKTTTVTERATSQERERVLYVMSKRGSGHLLLRETRLRYAGLGPRLGKSSAENFATVISLLREHASAAYYDDRLLRQRKGARNLRVSGTSTQRTVSTSNVADVDLAVHLISIAVLQGQI